MMPLSGKNVFIAGMARSGTSMTTGVFARLGLYTGEVMEATEMNPEGFYERHELIDVNVDLLQKAGFEYHNTWNYDSVSDGVKAALADMPPSEMLMAFAETLRGESPWVMKDVRSCYTMPVWLKVLDLENTCIIVVRRSSDSVYHSIKRRSHNPDAISQELVDAICRDHFDTVVGTLQKAGVPYLEVDYDVLLQDGEAGARLLADFTGYAVTGEHLNIRKELNHSSLRDRTLISIRNQFYYGPLRPLYGVARKLTPDALLDWAFPERKVVGKGEQQDRSK